MAVTYFQRRKGGRSVGPTTLQHSCARCLEALKASTFWSPVQGQLYSHRQSYRFCCTRPISI